MNDSFFEMIKEQRKRYPKMEPQDYGKLIYQSEFGPEHMIKDKSFVLSFLQEELSQLPKETSPQSFEAIGEHLCRFPLSACTSPNETELLAELFVRTAKKQQGSMDGIWKKLEQLEEFQISGMTEWVQAWKEKGCPPVHHSNAYRNAYHPHYRLLRKEYALYFPVLSEISRLMEIHKKKTPIIVSIDGRCGSGKTKLAALLEELFVCNVIHADDFYLPSEKRQENWKESSDGNLDFTRLYEEILIPAKSGSQIFYRPYDCQRGSIAKEIPMPLRSLTVVEGSYSQHPFLSKMYDLKIFLTCSGQEQVSRLKIREKSYFPAFLEIWIPMEENYFKRFLIEENSDVRIDTGLLF